MRSIALQQMGEKFFVAIYNDQGWKSHLWWFIKLIYNRLPRFLKYSYALVVSALVNFLVIVKHTIKLQPMVAISPLLHDKKERGMSAKYDKIDWIGGFPYEYATFATLADYFASRGFVTINSRESTSLGCHELALRRK